MPSDDGFREAPGPCDHCGGTAERSDDGGVPVFECADCGNVLGLAASSEGPDGTAEATEGPDSGVAAGAAEDGLSTETVRATDGSLDQLVGLLRSESDAEEPHITTGELLVDVGSVTLEITGEDGEVELRIRSED